MNSLLFDQMRSRGMKVDAFEVWHNHIEGCQICRKACRLRFAGGNTEQIYNKCCEIGKPLYNSFLEESEFNNENL